ncbi:MAG TPA: tetratricopeptide repeat protein [Candidatus Limnocylindria bacterium]|jgi:hypothetical protein|nr:tetratricopeptide repeat protein [Candidatus Limnocylindria bacterium]
MSRPKSSKPAHNQPVTPAKPAGQFRSIGLGIAAFAIAAIGVTYWRSATGNNQVRSTPAEAGYQRRPDNTLTFCKDVAVILDRNCVTCHRPGQSGPFPLVDYAEVQKHAREIATVTGSRYMPPWLPEHGYGTFEHERRLTADEIGILQQWVAEGAVKGNEADLPVRKTWSDTWQLGKPDLIVDLPAYTLPAEGKDIYRNLVAAIPVPARRFVRAVEFRPGNPKVVHHAFIEVDETRRSRQRADREQPPGFDGMESPETASMPGGQLLGWQPGKTPGINPDGLAWVLNPNTDLVLQMHLNPSGKKELVQPRVAFYFTDVAPTNSTFRLRLTALELDIPPGVSNYVAEQSYTLPVDASVVRVGAHAHYLARDMQGFATLPDGRREELIWIKDWDFKWQGDYAYQTPVPLPKGAKITMRYTYDNTTNNVRNPNTPPQRVRFGLQSRDEMGELYFQVLPQSAADYATLTRDFSQYYLGVSLGFFRNRIAFDPRDAEAHKRLGRILGYQGKPQEGLAELTEAARLNPADGEVHYDLGSIYIRNGAIAEAYTEFQTVSALDPNDGQALGSLGIAAAQLGKLQEARNCFETALRINPDDQLASSYLARVNTALQQRGK